MRFGRKQWALLASGLLGLNALQGPSLAQEHYGMPMPETPAGPAGPKANPFSMANDGRPNAFNEEDVGRPIRGPGDRIILRGEYLHWRVTAGTLGTPVVTSSTQPDASSNFGALGQTATTTVVGAGPYSLGDVTGGRATLGLAVGFLPPIEISGFRIEQNSDLFNFSGNGSDTSPVISRPVQFSNLPGQLGLLTEGVYAVNFPGAVAGSLVINSNSDFWGIEPLFVWPICCTDVLQVSGLIGYRHLQFNEQLTFNQTNRAVSSSLLSFGGDPTGFDSAYSIAVNDTFQTDNQFDGVQLGLRTALDFWRFNVGLDTKVGLGGTNRSFTNSGFSTLIGPAASLTLPGGVLNTPSNSGTQTGNSFSVVPELSANVRFRIHDNVRLIGGYSMIYWNNISRPGRNVQRVVDGREVPTDVSYTPGFRNETSLIPNSTSHLLLYGWSLGVEIVF